MEVDLMTEFKMIFGALLGVVLFLVGKYVIDHSNDFVVYFAGFAMVGIGIFCEIVVVFSLLF